MPLAGLSGGPEVRGVQRGCYQRWQRRIADDGLAPVTATLVRLAVDGWWMARLLDMAPPHDDLHVQVRARPAATAREGGRLGWSS
ncbi:hypothetical protein [Microtetraspora malaysiensis]|uniref:hypothetical protein n=1 Tax=Microtetraspora malaysiensis TaxID=161358 RepID=UPI003D93BB6A